MTHITEVQAENKRFPGKPQYTVYSQSKGIDIVLNNNYQEQNKEVCTSMERVGTEEVVNLCCVIWC